MVSVDDLNALLLADFETGALIWRERPLNPSWNSRLAGVQALNSLDKDGYMVGEVLGHGVKSHRVVYAMYHGHWPNHTIDHINGDRTDNRVPNLRDVTQKENTRNATLAAGSLSGMTGVTWNKSSNKWVARAMVDGGQFYLGAFKNLDEAISSREVFNKEKGFHINHGKR
ncbi:MAG: hypothetical protein GQ574_14720 [Crocinitomix sp.]|nr:hypothetical protein [Crocinitomix sp.]